MLLPSNKSLSKSSVLSDAIAEFKANGGSVTTLKAGVGAGMKKNKYLKPTAHQKYLNSLKGV